LPFYAAMPNFRMYCKSHLPINANEETITKNNMTR
jgi:hypothetical protein